MTHSERWYLERGFSPEAARYFAGGGRKISAVAALDGHVLVLDFDNGERRLLDCSGCFGSGAVFEALRSPEAFKRVFWMNAGTWHGTSTRRSTVPCIGKTASISARTPVI